ncbi:amino acid ABC transporter permease [soil metagenome]
MNPINQTDVQSEQPFGADPRPIEETACELPLRRPGLLRSYCLPAAVIAVAILFVWSLASNRNLEWPIVARYMLHPAIVEGVLLTLILTAVAMAVGSVLGLLVALCRLSASRTAVLVAWWFVWIFRGTPVLVQLVFWYNLALLYPVMSIGLPFGPTLWSASTNQVISPAVAAVLGLGLNAAAYLSENFRAGISAIDSGQIEAATSLGLRRPSVFLWVVAPQAMRIVVPSVTNEAVSMLKMTSLVSVLAIPELFGAAQAIYSRTYETIPLLFVVTFWYLLMVSLLTLLTQRVEAHFSKGFSKRKPAAPMVAKGAGMAAKTGAAT